MKIRLLAEPKVYVHVAARGLFGQRSRTETRVICVRAVVDQGDLETRAIYTRHTPITGAKYYLASSIRRPKKEQGDTRRYLRSPRNKLGTKYHFASSLPSTSLAPNSISARPIRPPGCGTQYGALSSTTSLLCGADLASIRASFSLLQTV